jgi:hypothetical protein
MNAYLLENGIKKELTAVYSPQQNGCAERLNRTLLEKTQCLLRDANLPPMFWGEALKTANFIRNYSKTKICREKVPIELWTGRKPSVKFFRIFGCCAYARIPTPSRRGKLGPRATKGIFMGYDEGRKAYRVWSQDEERMIHSRDVRFIENERGWKSKAKEEDKKDITEYALIDLGGATQIDEVVEEQDIPEDRSDQEERDSEEGGNESIQSTQEEQSSEDDDQPDDDDLNVQEVVQEEDEVINIQEVVEDRRNLRPRTSSVKPVKYSMMAKDSKEPEPSLEELTRKFGWRKDFDF